MPSNIQPRFQSKTYTERQTTVETNSHSDKEIQKKYIYKQEEDRKINIRTKREKNTFMNEKTDLKNVNKYNVFLKTGTDRQTDR